ncbi:MAG: hypothetical protein SAJ12_15125 [Jaaginema sp. PMC 1079.18]|nr:hypothetical protein [Jaaginema sp. PMC 1080.18]MEC4852316.1 hypothetical protein [Jaaginema sp. PMC 1079.18]MEC4865350.1 hypothetical protein [Jaaginema sp. PMC 1078.18]
MTQSLNTYNVGGMTEAIVANPFPDDPRSPKNLSAIAHNRTNFPNPLLLWRLSCYIEKL